ncbi:F-box domain-containing protein [Mycena venus]|uniref:F-box domain-containing protein n=1 Tax=Mycena venus TaxID=2733690 RepID=A0A8H6X9W4_9AGAR|nr:F-box domain-containing protein [Mycena venus]
MVQAWLHRSGHCPLSIYCEELCCIEDEMLEVLARHRARWEHVRLDILPTRLPLLKGPMPLLRKLEIQVATNGDINLTFSEVPQLTSVTLWDFRYPTGLIPWSQLTSLILIYNGSHQYTPVLKQTFNLVHCELILGDEEEIPETDIHLPRLECLTIAPYYVHSDPLSTGFLQSFIVPALCRLQVPETFLAPDPIAELMAFIPKSQCTLKELRITGERSLSRYSYRKAFPSIPDITFSKRRDWISGADEKPGKLGRSMSDFEYE